MLPVQPSRTLAKTEPKAGIPSNSLIIDSERNVLGCIWQLIKKSAEQWNQDNALRFSAALSYYTVFSIGPVVLLVIAIVGLWFGQAAAKQQLSGEFQKVMGPEGAKAIEIMIASVRNPSSGIFASLVAIAVMLFGAVGVFTELKSDLNQIWKCDAKVTTGLRGFLKDRLLSFLLILAIGALLLISILSTTVINATAHYFEAWLPMPLLDLQLLSFATSFLLVLGLFSLMLRILPDVDLKWKDVIVGAFTAAILFTLGKDLLAFYLGRSAVASAYGASASLVLIMMWTYYSSLIFFFGAELSKVYAHNWGSLRGEREE